MELEKRNSGDSPPESGPAKTGRKPVIVYIMILFIVAFLLMAFSFLIHQRSNAEVLGELHSNVNALEELQDAMDENLALQKELDDASKTIASLENEITGAGDSLALLKDQRDALLALCALEQQYAAGDYAACAATLRAMEAGEQAALLPTEAPNGAAAPAQRYQTLKEAVAAQAAE